VLKLFETATHVLVEATPGECDQLVDEFQFKPNGYFFAPSYERYLASKGKEGWDGFIRPVRRISRTGCKALRGRLGDILKWASDNDYRVDTEKLLPSPFAHLTFDDIEPDIIAGSFQLDDHQRACILGWLQNNMGIAQVTVSGGKTAMFAGAAAFIKRHYPQHAILYITPSERLVRQSTKELKKFMPNMDVGQFGGGHFQHGAKDVVVCTTAMLNKHFMALDAKNWFRRFIAVFYDEVHHAGSKTSQKILEAVPAFFRFGASDTTKEDDERRWNDIRGLFGPVVNVVKAAPLMKVGRIAKPYIYIVDVKDWNNRFEGVGYKPLEGSKAFVLIDDEWKVGKYLGPVHETDDEGEVVTKPVKTAIKDEQDEWIVEDQPIIVTGLHRIELEGAEHHIPSKWCLLDRAYDRCIIQFRERNDAIVKWAAYYSNLGLPTVVVCTRTLHVYILEALLKKAVKPELVDILVGKDTPKARDDCFDWFKATPGSILITPLVKEGVSINEIRAGVIADYVADWEVANQMVGRFIRQKTGDNRASITWFRDRQHPILRRGCNTVFQNLHQIEGYHFYDPAPSDPAKLTEQGELGLV